MHAHTSNPRYEHATRWEKKRIIRKLYTNLGIYMYKLVLVNGQIKSSFRGKDLYDNKNLVVVRACNGEGGDATRALEVSMGKLIMGKMMQLPISYLYM